MAGSLHCDMGTGAGTVNYRPEPHMCCRIVWREILMSYADARIYGGTR